MLMGFDYILYSKVREVFVVRCVGCWVDVVGIGRVVVGV